MNAGWMNGKILNERDMVLPVRDLGILRGYGVFDFLRTYGKKPFHLDDHIIRLKQSADQIGLTIPYSVEDIENAIGELLAETDQGEVGLRVVCTGGISRDGMTSQDGINLFILVDPLNTWPSEWYREGVKISTYSHMRYRPESKSLNYIPAMEAMNRAKESGAVEALYCDEHGRVLEGTTSNIFFRKQGKWFTPGRDILKGVTRQVVLNLIGEENARTEDLYLDDLKNAEEVFITASTKEIMPVTQVDDWTYGCRTGPETEKVMKAFKEYVASPERWVTVTRGDI